MAQINGADARIIVRKERTFKTLPVVPVHPCELAFDELVDGDVVVTLDTSIFRQGAKSNKLAVADGCGAGDILATDAIAAKDLSHCTKIGMWIRSSVALAEGDLKLLLDDTVSCGSPLESIDIPAIVTADINIWKYVKLTLAAPATDTAIISVGIKMIVDKGAFDLWLDDIRGLEGDAIIIPFNTGKFGMQEDLEESNAISSGRQPQKPTGGAISGAGSSNHELNPYMAILMKHILGAVATTDLTGGKYQHVITIGDLGEGLALEVQHTKEKIFTVYHIKGNTMSISQNATGKVMMDCGWEIAKEEAETNETTLDGDPTNYGHKPFSAKFGAFSEGGGSAPGLATTFKIDYTNNVEGEPTIGSEGEKDSLTEGRAKVNFSVDMLYKDNTYMDKAKTLTESKIKMENTNGTGVGSLGNEYMSIETPEVLYARPQQSIDGPKGLKANFTGIAYYDDDAGGETITITIRSTQAVVA
jgi:hypothetical protein